MARVASACLTMLVSASATMKYALASISGGNRSSAMSTSVGRSSRSTIAHRLAPEHPHPAGLADCVAAIRWLAAHGEREFGARRLIVGGESAGAHLAALALLVLRDRGEIGAVAAANLAYGVYDVSMTPSARSWGAQRIVINTPDLAFFAEQYAPSERHRDPDVSPLYADLTGMPLALFTCGTFDPLLDDTLFMAARWQRPEAQPGRRFTPAPRTSSSTSGTRSPPRRSRATRWST